MPQDEEVMVTTTRQGHRIVKRSYVESDNEEITTIRVKRSYVESDDGGAGITQPRNGRRIFKRFYGESDDSDDEPANRQFDSASARSHSTTHAEGSSLKERRELPPSNTDNLDLADPARADADSLEPRPEPSLDSRDAPASHTDTEFDDMLDLVSPAPAPLRAQIPNPRKHRRESGNGTDDELASTSATNKSVLAFAKQFATHKRLKPVHVSEVEAFAADPEAVRQIKIYTAMLGLDARLESTPTAPKLSHTLEKNIRQLALGVLMSANLTAYKGFLPRKHVLELLKKKRVHVAASDWAAVAARVEYHLAHTRSAFRKFIKRSIKARDPHEHINILALSQRFVWGTNTPLTVSLCARVALMRKYYLLYPKKDDDLWDKLDLRLAWIRENAAGDPDKEARMWNVLLDNDRKAHGREAEYAMPEDVVVVSGWQQEVDDVVSAAAV